MSLTTLSDILVASRLKMRQIPPSRDVAALFLEHTTNTPFEESPIAGADGFEVVSDGPAQVQGFGLTDVREWRTNMVVKLGHGSAEVDKTREEWVAEDVERVVDLLEGHTWPDGTQLVLHTATETIKVDANWWITKLTFTLIWLGAVRTS